MPSARMGKSWPREGDEAIILWDPKTRKPLGPPLTGPENTEAGFQSGWQNLASASKEKTIILWDPKTRQTLGPPLKGDQDKV